MPNLLSLCNISKQYILANHPVCGLNKVSLSIRRGEFLAVIGHSGSGKSTLMNLLGALDLPTSGEYFFASQEFGTVSLSQLSDFQLSKLRNREIGFIFQNFNLITSLTALENIELPLIYRGYSKQLRNSLAQNALKRVGLFERSHHFPSQLSGGQQQRVAIARAIASSPPLILADEPTGNLDPQSASDVVAVFKELHMLGKTIVLITHDPSIAKVSDRIIKIENGFIVEDSINV